MDSLKTCPFCGGEAHFTDDDARAGIFIIGCKNWRDCGCKLSFITTRVGAIKAWNRRVNDG